MFNVVLVEPEIPPNTGNVGRLCLAAGSTLHLVKPLGFSLDDRQLQRAGLDYWKEVDLRVWDSLQALQVAQEEGRGQRPRLQQARYFFVTTKSQRSYHEVQFERGDFLVFGRETKGLPEPLLAANAERTITIPMLGTRSQNLATAVAIVLFEAVRQQSISSATLNAGSPTTAFFSDRSAAVLLVRPVVSIFLFRRRPHCGK